MKMLPWLAIALSSILPLPLPAAESAPVDQLGQAHPAVPDVSTNPNWHVYRFQRAGIEYLQVNALDDQPRLAVAVAQGTALVLPIGNDANRVQVMTSSEQPTTNSSDSTQQRAVSIACSCEHRPLSSPEHRPLSSTPQPLQAESATTPVYQDSDVKINNVPSSDGDTWQVQPATID